MVRVCSRGLAALALVWLRGAAGTRDVQRELGLAEPLEPEALVHIEVEAAAAHEGHLGVKGGKGGGKKSKKPKSNDKHAKAEKQLKKKKVTVLPLPRASLADIQRQDRDLGEVQTLAATLDGDGAFLEELRTDLAVSFHGDVLSVLAEKLSSTGAEGCDGLGSGRVRITEQNAADCGALVMSLKEYLFFDSFGACSAAHGAEPARIQFKRDGVTLPHVLVLASDGSVLLAQEDESEAHRELLKLQVKLSNFFGTVHNDKKAFELMLNHCMQGHAAGNTKAEYAHVFVQYLVDIGFQMLKIPKHLHEVQHLGGELLDKVAGMAGVLASAGQQLLEARAALDPSMRTKYKVDTKAVRRKLQESRTTVDHMYTLFRKDVDESKAVMVQDSEFLKMERWEHGDARHNSTSDRRAYQQIVVAVERARDALESLDKRFLSVIMPLSGAFSRMDRLLTPGGAATEDGWDSSEADAEALHRLAAADLSVFTATEDPVSGPLKELYDRVESAVEGAQEGETKGLLSLLGRGSALEASVTQAAALEALRAAQEHLRQLPAFGTSELQVWAGEFEGDKAAWAKNWARIRSASDFTTWPVVLDEEETVAPKICEAGFMYGDEYAEFPAALGGGRIMHSFVVFAGGPHDGGERPGCVEVLHSLVEHFGDDEEGPRAQRRAARLGCVGFEGAAEALYRLRKHLQDEVRKMTTLHLTIVQEFPAEASEDGHGIMQRLTGKKANKTSVTKEVSITIGSPEEGRKRKQKHRRNVAKGVVEGIVSYMLHGMMKYAIRSGEAGGPWWNGAKASFAKNPPVVDVWDLAGQYRQQLHEAQLPTPYDEERCPETDENGNLQCSPWDSSVPGMWTVGKLRGESVAFVQALVDSAMAGQEAGAWSQLGQGPALYGGAGFDSPGVVDNSGWDCENTTHVCEVHPKCARIAAQMIQYPFMGAKKYASEWIEKGRVAAGMKLGMNSFDEDGFHRWCHAPGLAYCWSYTVCVSQMMNYLCSLPETAEHCCPSAEVRTACSTEGPNSAECEVCKDVREVPEEEKLEDVVVPARPLEGDRLAFLKADARDLELRQAETAEAYQRSVCDRCAGIKKAVAKQGSELLFLVLDTDPICEDYMVEDGERAVPTCEELCGVEDEDEDDLPSCKLTTVQSKCSELCA